MQVFGRRLSRERKILGNCCLSIAALERSVEAICRLRIVTISSTPRVVHYRDLKLAAARVLESEFAMHQLLIPARHPQHIRGLSDSTPSPAGTLDGAFSGRLSAVGGRRSAV